MSQPLTPPFQVRSDAPLLTGTAAEGVRSAVRDVVEDFDPTFLRDDFSLSSGWAGAALTFAYAARCLDRGDLLEAARRAFERSLEGVARAPVPAALHGGFVGTAWVAAHLAADLLEPDETEDFFEDIDATLRTYLERGGDAGDFDLIGGVAGIGVYALERSRTDGGRRLLQLCVDRILELSCRRHAGTAWHTPADLLPPDQREDAPDGYYNLGIAHGIPGVLAFLARAQTAGTLDRRGLDHLESGTDWLLGRARRVPRGFRFPNWIRDESDTASETATRLAWCYGDLGVAAALADVAEATGRAEWREEARAMAVGCTEIPIEETRVRDTGLCHGTAGVAHLLQRLGRRFDDPALLRAAGFWYSVTLQMRRPGTGAGGFFVHRIEPRSRLEDPDSFRHREEGFLTGSGGTALSLMAAISTVPPDWDRVLLIS